MSQPQPCFQSINARGACIRRMTVYSQQRVTELSYQRVLQQWVVYKRIVRSVHG